MTAMWCVRAIWCLTVCAGAGAAPPLTYVRGSDGAWREVPVQLQAGRVVLSITPEMAPAGHARLVVHKPTWMRLEDSTPPRVTSAQIGQVRVAVTEVLDLGVYQGRVPPIRLTVADDLNPPDPASLRFGLSGVAQGIQVDAPGLGPPALAGECVVTLPELAPGTYEGEFSVTDLSPQANALRLPYRLTILGGTVAPDSSWVRLAGPGGTYQMDAAPRVPLTVVESDVQAYLTGQIGGTWMYARGINEVRPIVDEPGRQIWRLTCGVGDADGKPMEVAGRFEFDLELRGDLPCLLVRSRCFNQVAEGEVYNFWGWLPGDGFDTADGHKTWAMVYQNVGKVGWVYLPSTRPGKPGVGWISPLVFGESRFGTMLLYTSPQRIVTKIGEAVEMSFAIMPARGADEVAAVATKLNELGLWQP